MGDPPDRDTKRDLDRFLAKAAPARPGPTWGEMPLPRTRDSVTLDGSLIGDAIWMHVTDRDEGRRYFDLKCRATVPNLPADNPFTADDWDAFKLLEQELLDDLLAKLISGRLVATCYPPGALRRRKLSTDWWHGARVNLIESSVTSNNVTVSNVRVAEPMPQEAAVAPEDAAEPIASEQTEPPVYATGVQGRPTAKHLWQAEMIARAERGELAQTVTEEAASLHQWMLSTHPGAPSATQKTIKNDIRDSYRNLKRPK